MTAKTKTAVNSKPIELEYSEESKAKRSTGLRCDYLLTAWTHFSAYHLQGYSNGNGLWYFQQHTFSGDILRARHPEKAYLKEISSLAKAIITQGTLQDCKSVTDSVEMWNRLLRRDQHRAQVHCTRSAGTHDPVGVMRAELQLEAVPVVSDLTSNIISPFILAVPGGNLIVLCQDRDLVLLLEGQSQIVTQLSPRPGGRSRH